MSATYPKRPSHFAHKFTRLLLKACVANELGPQATLLLIAIAHTEDAKGYRGPVTFWNPQLFPLIGVNSEATFKRIRSKCKEAGWLVHHDGAHGKIPVYWVTIPGAYGGWDDGPTDETQDDFIATTGKNAPTGGPNVSLIRSQCELNSSLTRAQSEPNVGLTWPTFFPSPNPSPDPGPRQTDPQTPVASAPDPEPEPYDPLRAEQAARKLFEQRWATAGLRKFSRLSPSHQTRLVGLLLDPWWAEHYPAALERAGRIPWLRDGAGRQRGAYDVSEFLRDADEVRKILDGVYDPRAPTAPPTSTGPPAPAPIVKPLKETALDRVKRIAEANGVKVLDTKPPEPAPCPAPTPSPPPNGTSNGSPTTPPRSASPSTSAA
ncbi:Phage replication protein O OS=Rhodopirellula sp. SWK7 GN=RRSWK_03022 PE=4 SV=1 [Gemmata massiliana]|uniref:Phage replication protein O n=1 Tax=Gemmata massiliana TaxID=1210884 RepID=A0A6P2D4G4_9BACT|nr:hypothetical protein [Gemmata massiliana]VTR96019.1 Phage replication protein O OS=Rhodopirellula sp. SWK7 GN=RRSWK_03022 PE=4 SV=1 [Gemmata massiliana]